jgi:asparagine synthase (glutamine-hydrolysing)
MGKLLANRGPDDEAFYDDGALSLVYRRLSIVDLPGGKQPIFSEDGTKFIVANGEIYNHLDLRRQLGDRHRFSTHSDSEVPLHLFEDEGPKALEQLRGMFALAIWDKSERRLFLARDRLGIKPLYICRLPNGLLFGSELKALLVHPDCPRDMDWTALFQPGPHQLPSIPTYVRGIEHLPAGHYLEATKDRVETKCWWRIDERLGTAPFGSNAIEYRREFERLIEESTFEHLLGDVPVGLHLSGGTDSSLLAAIVAKRSNNLACFSVVERSTWRAGDVTAARKVTETLQLPWHPVLFDQRTLLDDIQFDLARLEQSVHMMDSPRFDLEWIFKEELHRFARHELPQMKAVLLGQGIDEFAGGYSRRIDRPHHSWQAYLADEVGADLRHWQSVREGLPERLRNLAHRDERSSELSPYHRQMRAFSYQLQHFQLWHEDRTSSSQSLEARVPFLDHRIVELLASVPPELHPLLFWNKRIVRDVLAKRLSSYDLEHPKVPFFITGDAQDLNVMLHGMLQRCVPAFLDKYLSDPSLPFEPDLLREMAMQVLNHGENFYAEGWRLMECMVIAIFARQCREPDGDDFHAIRARHAGTARVEPYQWADIEASFSSPVAPSGIDWVASDRLAIAPGSRVLAALNSARSFELAGAAGIYSSISVPAGMDWVGSMLRHLGNAQGADFTVEDWADEFDLDMTTLRSALDALYQAGFIVRATAMQNS